MDLRPCPENVNILTKSHRELLYYYYIIVLVLLLLLSNYFIIILYKPPQQKLQPLGVHTLMFGATHFRACLGSPCNHISPYSGNPEINRSIIF